MFPWHKPEKAQAPEYPTIANSAMPKKWHRVFNVHQLERLNETLVDRPVVTVQNKANPRMT